MFYLRYTGLSSCCEARFQPGEAFQPQKKWMFKTSASSLTILVPYNFSMRKFTRTFQNILHSENFTFSYPFSLRVLTTILIFWKERELLGDRINISTLITAVWFRVCCILYISFCSQGGWYFCTAFWWLMSLQTLKGCIFTKAKCRCKLSQGMLIQTLGCQKITLLGIFLLAWRTY